MSTAQEPSVRITNVFNNPPAQALNAPNTNFDLLVTDGAGTIKVAPGASVVIPVAAGITAIAYDTGPGNSGGKTSDQVDIG